jgi:hypothetical protein
LCMFCWNACVHGSILHRRVSNIVRHISALMMAATYGGFFDSHFFDGICYWFFSGTGNCTQGLTLATQDATRAMPPLFCLYFDLR